MLSKDPLCIFNTGDMRSEIGERNAASSAIFSLGFGNGKRDILELPGRLLMCLVLRPRLPPP